MQLVGTHRQEFTKWRTFFNAWLLQIIHDFQESTKYGTTKYRYKLYDLFNFVDFFTFIYWLWAHPTVSAIDCITKEFNVPFLFELWELITIILFDLKDKAFMNNYCDQFYKWNNYLIEIKKYDNNTSLYKFLKQAQRRVKDQIRCPRNMM